MGKVKLYAVIGGRNYWRLRTDREAAQYLREIPCNRVAVILPNETIYLDGQMATYGYCSLSHPRISQWIIDNHWNRARQQPPVAIPFQFTIEGNCHVFRYVGSRRG